MASRKRTVIASEVQDVLNYFGRCPICDYPAQAWHLTAQFDDGVVESQTIAACGGWCGWKGPVSPTTMTGETAVLTHESGCSTPPRRQQPPARPMKALLDSGAGGIASLDVEVLSPEPGSMDFAMLSDPTAPTNSA
ncbi:hypothetical protein [Nocardia sp. NPDC058480]|uniref:hypothetical protein n=1 Tax=Nocardia sp. NPDC058480 TaxID=3346522 RepID=UPI00364F5E21